MKKIIIITLLLLFPLSSLQSIAARKPLKKISSEPYLAAITLDADTGEVLFEENADTTAYPASVLKLMTLLLVLEAVESGEISLSDMVQITSESSRMGGSQVYLDPKEQFSVEDLLYALMVQSANDAAVALAIHIAGSKAAFVEKMNERAQQLGMKSSRFYSVHGLPPSSGQEVDITTARDLALLCLELVKKPKTFLFTAAKEREFRGGTFIMRTHNHLLETLAGCDGLKTGYFTAAGFSIAATAKRQGRRVITIILGSAKRKIRDIKARELVEQGFDELLPLPQNNMPETVAGEVQPEKSEAVKILETTTLAFESEESSNKQLENNNSDWWMFLYGFFCGVGVCLVVIFLRLHKKRGIYRYSR